MMVEYRCTCQKCCKHSQNGKLVSRSTFLRHRRSSRDPSSSQSTLQIAQSKSVSYRCICPRFPHGHFFTSRSAFYRHRLFVKNTRQGQSPLPASTPELNTNTISPAPESYQDTASPAIGSRQLSTFSSISPTRPSSQTAPCNPLETSHDSLETDDRSYSSDNDIRSGEMESEDELIIGENDPMGGTDDDLLSDEDSNDLGAEECMQDYPSDDISDGDSDIGFYLQIVQWAQGISRRKYEELRSILADRVKLPSLYRVSKRLDRFTNIGPKFIDCCPRNCVAFTGDFSDREECPLCGEKRFVQRTTHRHTSSGRSRSIVQRPRKTFVHIPLASRLRCQFSDPERAKILKSYRQGLTESASHDGDCRDFFDGELFKNFHVNDLGLFRDPRDIALHMSLDGVQLTNMKHFEVTPVILINLNLPPEIRYRANNILASVLIPGPKKPKDLDSFLRPLIDELLSLDDGIEMYDNDSEEYFILRAWVTMVTGDGPALADAIGMKRPGNAFRPCRTCMIEATPTSGKYYVPHTNHDFNNPPLRDGLRQMIDLVEQADSGKYSKLTGITRSSILLKLRSLHFPRSFPADIMHLVLQNVTPNLYKLWSGSKLAIDDPKHEMYEQQRYFVQKRTLRSIGQALSDARPHIPTFLSHSPRPIDLHYEGYKASEWEGWVKYFGIPLLDQNLDEACVNNFQILSRFYRLATQYSIPRKEIAVIGKLAEDFIRSYEQLYYQGDNKRLPVCSVNIHYLSHFADYIRDCGPSRYWWQFPMERFCGIIKPQARSKVKLDVSLANALVLSEHLNHIQFVRKTLATVPLKAHPSCLDEYSSQLTHRQGQQLQSIYGHFEFVGFFKRYRLSNDLIIGSAKSQRVDDVNRSNNRICFCRPGKNEFEFGVIQFFLILRTNTVTKQLAHITRLEDIDLDREKRIVSYGKEGTTDWIETGWICSLVGVLREGGVKFLVTDIELFAEVIG